LTVRSAKPRDERHAEGGSVPAVTQRHRNARAGSYAAEKEALLRRLRRIEGQKAMLETISGLMDRDSRQGEIPRESLAGLAMPVTVVWGDADPVLPYAQSENLPASWTFMSLPGVGHMLPVEARKAATAAIRASIRRGENRIAHNNFA